jgi:hypothetical protein
MWWVDDSGGTMGRKGRATKRRGSHTAFSTVSRSGRIVCHASLLTHHRPPTSDLKEYHLLIDLSHLYYPLFSIFLNLFEQFKGRKPQ